MKGSLIITKLTLIINICERKSYIFYLVSVFGIRFAHNVWSSRFSVATVHRVNSSASLMVRKFFSQLTDPQSKIRSQFLDHFRNESFSVVARLLRPILSWIFIHSVLLTRYKCLAFSPLSFVTPQTKHNLLWISVTHDPFADKNLIKTEGYNDSWRGQMTTEWKHKGLELRNLLRSRNKTYFFNMLRTLQFTCITQTSRNFNNRVFL